MARRLKGRAWELLKLAFVIGANTFTGVEDVVETAGTGIGAGAAKDRDEKIAAMRAAVLTKEAISKERRTYNRKQRKAKDCEKTNARSNDNERGCKNLNPCFYPSTL